MTGPGIPTRQGGEDVNRLDLPDRFGHASLPASPATRAALVRAPLDVDHRRHECDLVVG